MTRETVYQGKKIRLALHTLTRPDGSTMKREVVVHPGAVVILPVLADGSVCLVRNRRFAVGEVLLELPAGTLQPPEPPEAAAVRELAEETGYSAAAWRKLAEFFPSPGVMDERMFLFLAEGLTPGRMHLEPDEDLEPCLVPWDRLMTMCLDGTIRDAKTLVGVLLWDRLRRGAGG